MAWLLFLTGFTLNSRFDNLISLSICSFNVALYILNHGLKYTNSEFFACLDVDGYVDSQAMKHIMREFTDDNVAAVMPVMKVAETHTMLQKVQWLEYILNIVAIHKYPILYSFRRCPYAMRARFSIRLSGIKVELRDLVIDTLNYFWKEYDIPILHNLEYYIEIAKEELWENVQEFDEKERRLHTESLKFYEKDDSLL